MSEPSAGAASRLPGVTVAEAAAFEQAGLATIDDIWNALGPGGPDAVAAMASRTNLDQDRLLHLLAAQAFAVADESAAKPTQHLSAFLLFLGLTVLLAFAGIAAAAVFGTPISWLAREVGAAPGLRAGPAALPPHRPLRDSNLVVASVPRGAGGLTSLESVRGRYPLSPIASGAVLTADLLSAETLPEAALADRYLLTVPLAVAPSRGLRQVPFVAKLLLAPQSPGIGLLVDDVLVLSLHERGEGANATVAVRQDQIERLGAALGYSAVFVVEATGAR